MRKFAERLKELRMEFELTLDELSERTGIGKSSLSRWEREEADIKSDDLVILAKLFDVSTDYLLGLENIY